MRLTAASRGPRASAWPGRAPPEGPRRGELARPARGVISMYVSATVRSCPVERKTTELIVVRPACSARSQTNRSPIGPGVARPGPGASVAVDRQLVISPIGRAAADWRQTRATDLGLPGAEFMTDRFDFTERWSDAEPNANELDFIHRYRRSSLEFCHEELKALG